MLTVIITIDILLVRKIVYSASSKGPIITSTTCTLAGIRAIDIVVTKDRSIVGYSRDALSL